MSIVSEPHGAQASHPVKSCFAHMSASRHTNTSSIPASCRRPGTDEVTADIWCENRSAPAADVPTSKPRLLEPTAK